MTATRPDDPGACVFCAALAAAEDSPENLVVRREPLAFLILNR